MFLLNQQHLTLGILDWQPSTSLKLFRGLNLTIFFFRHFKNHFWTFIESGENWRNSDHKLAILALPDLATLFGVGESIDK